MNISPKLILALTILFFFNAFNDAFAAQVAAVKDKKVLVQGDDLELNALYYVVSDGKKKGIIKITAIKGQKGMATLLKGSADKGYTLVFRPKKSKSSSQTVAEKPADSINTSTNKNYDKYSEQPDTKYSNTSTYDKTLNKKKPLHVGLMLGYSQNSADVDFGGGATDSLSGTGIGFKLFADYPMSSKINLRGEFGTMPFNADGAIVPPCSPARCTMAISYLGATLWGRYMFSESTKKARFWGGGNASLIFPTGTGNTNAVNADDVGSTLIFGLGGGVDYSVNEKFYVPISLEYNLFPPNDEVSANMIQFKAGLGMRL